MRSRYVVSILIAMVLCFSSVITVLANPYPVGPGTDGHDTWVDSSSTNYNASGQLRINGSSAGGPCVQSTGTLLQVDMTDPRQDTVDTATLEVVVQFAFIQGTSVTLELFEATSDFDENTVTGPLSSWIGGTLNSTVVVPASTSPGTVLTFSSQELADYAEAARTGDGDASVVIVMTSCPIGGHFVNLDEYETGTAAQFNFWDPSAVTLSSFEAADSSSQIQWGWLALFLAITASLVLLRRPEQVRQFARTRRSPTSRREHR